jgi:hypothetical protein
VGGGAGREDGCESWTQDAVVAAGQEQRTAQALVDDLVAVGVWYPADEAAEPKAAKVVCARTRRDATATERLEPLPQIVVGEAVGQEAEEDERVE